MTVGCETMASNETVIIDRYTNSYQEELRATRSRASGLEFHYTEKILREYVKPQSSVVEIGCGTGYYGLFLADKCASYHAVDVTPANIATLQKKIDEQHLTNVTASVGDATNLSSLKNSQYDVVLIFGPLYHLARGGTGTGLSGERARLQARRDYPLCLHQQNRRVCERLHRLAGQIPQRRGE